MKSHDRKKMYIILSVLIILIITITIAYSVLSSNLSISFNKVQQTNLSWHVYFAIPNSTQEESNLIVNTNSVNAYSVAGTSDSGRSCGVATLTNENTIKIAETHLSKPGDKCKWHFKLLNDGDIDALLTGLTLTCPKNGTSSSATSYECTLNTSNGQPVTDFTVQNIRIRVFRDASLTTRLRVTQSIVAANTTASSSNSDIYIVAEYNSDTLSSSTVNMYNASLQFTFTQN